MGRRRLLAFVLLGMLAWARPAHAGWLDIIWEMTGPRMIGIGAGCEISIARDPAKGCDFPAKGLPNGKVKDDWFWFSTDAFYYFSASHNGFNGGDVGGFAVDPMVLFSRIKSPRPNAQGIILPAKAIRVTAGAGFTFQRFWGDDFNSFGNKGFKFRPIGVEFPLGLKSLRANVAYNLRYYWDGFESIPAVDGTATTPRIPAVFRKVDKPETVHGIAISITF